MGRADLALALTCSRLLDRAPGGLIDSDARTAYEILHCMRTFRLLAAVFLSIPLAAFSAPLPVVAIQPSSHSAR